MAVLSEPADDLRAPSAELCVVVSPDNPENGARIATTLADNVLPTLVLQVDGPDELLEPDIDPQAILVLACDVDLPRDMATLRRVCHGPGKQSIVVISPIATGTGVRRALDAGADAIVFEPELESTLAVAISAVASGQSVVPRKLRASVERPAFSHRERQVLGYVAEGYTNAQIAEQLFLSESTIKSHLSSAFAKFGVRSRKEAATLFLELEQQNGIGSVEPRAALIERTSNGANR